MKQFGSLDGIYEHVEEVSKKSVRESLQENKDLADLSRELATIKTDCDLDFSYENAKAEGYFTKEAYALMKRLGFKNFLGRFDEEESRTESGLTEKFKKITEKAEAEKKTSLPKVIFINVVKVILWIVGVAGGIILLLILYAFIRNYHFELRKRGGRKSWLKTRKRKLTRYQKNRIAAAKRNIRQQKKRQRKEKKRSWEDDE